MNRMYRNNNEELIVRMAKYYSENGDIELLHKMLKDFDKIKNGHTPKEGNRVLVIGDLHEPFCLDGYLEHCIETYKTFDCNKVIFIGDVIDNHYSSFHNADPDGYSAGEELKLAINKINLWYKAFPYADVIIGNHDAIITRKAFSSSVSKEWVKEYSEVLETPNWKFVDSLILDDVLYVHGQGGSAFKTAQNESMSTVCGHTHTEASVKWVNNKIFGMNVGCGVDRSSYAMAYAKHFKQQILSCGVVIDGKQAYLSKM